MRITPTAANATAPLPISNWICHSRFRQAINLQNTQGTLLTLHRGHRVLSPMGWLLGAQAFDRLYPLLPPGTRCTGDGRRVRGAVFTLDAPRRRLTLRVPTLRADALLPLAHCRHDTGLCGPLSQAIQAVPALRTQIERELSRWSAGRVPQWQNIIGLGPGLTPSADDMLIGVMAILHATPRFAALLKTSPLLPPALALASLTTDISVSYLTQANQGRFSSLLIPLLRRLSLARAVPGLLMRDIERLLQHGHTSGADTLLGMHYALEWESFYQRGA